MRDYMYSLFRWHLINETQRELPTIWFILKGKKEKEEEDITSKLILSCQFRDKDLRSIVIEQK